ncbi:Patatin-like phospholipase [Roseivivax jejudonensis]|uniref:Patatin-like phospholipase n=1 Tax=Roseivivax jejudonensis TaxID=1529041 RepID=A0A1X7A673_9RHOB|nr:patatin-like phospholipase family protein [Roseivivax jejudonensis]SLN71711.1 Patatin-like phospholipase [Roseivivax jejudonensis]
MKRRVFLAAPLVAAACSAAPGPTLLPRERRGQVIPEYRLPADASFDIWRRHLDLSVMRKRPTILALSGGGEDGAFGAGLLNGWSATGKRPDFDLVTGVSTGALIAPFAFVGASEDRVLRRIYTTHDQGDILRSRFPGGIVQDAIFDSEPMRQLLDIYIDEALLERIAARHASGARMFVVTSNLDTGRAWIWNMGAIAAAGEIDLFRSVTLASASIPGVFPPVRIRLSTERGALSEAHVDGGVNMQLLAVPDAAFRNLSATAGSGGSLYLVINNTLSPTQNAVPRRALSIMQATFSSMVRASARQTTESARRYSERTGMAFEVAAVGPDFDVPFDASERFSLDYMRPLYRYGYTRATSGDAWR